jgi:Na+/proline symporter
MACGVIIAAPSVILSIVLGWNELLTVLLMGVTTTLYTMFGGVQAVTWTDVKQMVVIFLGLGVIFFVILGQLPETVSLGRAIELAGMTGRMKMVDPQLNLNETYTLWSGLLGGLFLALSYFGCDQSQVQRFLTARSVSEGRSSLLMSAFVKIPMQLLILFIGVLVFIFYQFVQPPLIFKADDRARVESLPRYQSLESDYSAAFAARRQAALDFTAGGGATARAAYEDATSRISEARRGAIGLIREQTGRNFSDVNYVFPTFVTTYAPIGVVGLIIAAIFAAAMSSVSAELAALSTATVIDFYRRHYRKEAPDAHYLKVSKLVTGLWGLFACLVALQAGRLGSLIEVVNKFGSYFYGSLLGVFVLAIGTKRANGHGAFVGLLAGMATVAVVANTTRISFLWYNVVGCLTVMLVGMLVSFVTAKRSA